MKKITAATLNISNQKNRVRQQTIYQEAINSPNCPVKTIIRRVKQITNHTTNQNTMIGTYFTKTNLARHVAVKYSNTAIKESVQELQLDKMGLAIDSVSSHSLRSGGAMAMHLNKVPATTIKRWDEGQVTHFLCIFTTTSLNFPKDLHTKCPPK